jgi:Flp pilus assembly protein TadD
LEAVTNALASWNKVFPANHPFLVHGLSTKIVILKERRAFQEAEQIIPEALKLALILYGPDHPERMFLLNNSAGVYLAEKKYAQAEALLHEAAGIGSCRLTAGHPLLNTVLQNYAYVLDKLNRKDEAARARAESQVLLAFPDRSNFYFIR